MVDYFANTVGCPSSTMVHDGILTKFRAQPLEYLVIYIIFRTVWSHSFGIWLSCATGIWADNARHKAQRECRSALDFSVLLGGAQLWLPRSALKTNEFETICTHHEIFGAASGHRTISDEQ